MRILLTLVYIDAHVSIFIVVKPVVAGAHERFEDIDTEGVFRTVVRKLNTLVDIFTANPIAV